jgi:hypothetical protein
MRDHEEKKQEKQSPNETDGKEYSYEMSFGEYNESEPFNNLEFPPLLDLVSIKDNKNNHVQAKTKHMKKLLERAMNNVLKRLQVPYFDVNTNKVTTKNFFQALEKFGKDHGEENWNKLNEEQKINLRDNFKKNNNDYWKKLLDNELKNDKGIENWKKLDGKQKENLRDEYQKNNEEYCLELLDTELRKKLEATIYIGGGVVRSIIGHVYRELYLKRYLQTELKKRKKILNKLLKKSEDDENKHTKMADIINGAEFQLLQNCWQTGILSATEVLGVGSDFDLYYTLSNTLGEIQLEKKTIEEKLTTFVNSAETSSGLRHYKSKLKHSLVPVADIKDYNTQLKRTLEQGGSMLDTLAFEIKIGGNAKLIEPVELRNKKEDIIENLIEGYYEYIPPPPEEYTEATVKQTIRGLRPLLELGFLQIKNEEQIKKELTRILQAVKDDPTGEVVTEDAISQIEKLVRNARFCASHNRAYRESSDSPLGLLLQILERVGVRDEKNVPSLPKFLSMDKIDANRNKEKITGKHRDEVEKVLMNHTDFSKNHTEDGILYHGTDMKNFMPILRGGFVVSSDEQGKAVFGTGLYTTKDKKTAKKYGGPDKIMIELKVKETENMRIINVDKLDALEDDSLRKAWFDLKESLEKEMDELPKYKHVNDLLKEKYKIDIIIHEHVLVQNYNVIEKPKNFGAYVRAAGTKYIIENINRENIIEYLRYLNLCELAKNLCYNIKQGISYQQIADKMETIFKNINDLKAVIKHSPQELKSFILNSKKIHEITSKLTNNDTDFKQAIEIFSSNKDSLARYIDQVQDRFPYLLKYPSSLKSALLWLNEEQIGPFLELDPIKLLVKATIKNGKNFSALFEKSEDSCLKKREAIFNSVVLKNLFPEIIKTSDDFYNALKRLNKSQRDSILNETMVNYLPSIIKESTDLNNILKKLSSNTIKKLLAKENMKKKLLDTQKNSNDIIIMLSGLNNEIKKTLVDIMVGYEIIPRVLKCSQDFGKCLSQIKPQQITELLKVNSNMYQCLQDSIKKGVDFKEVFKPLNDGQRDVLFNLEKIVGHMITKIESGADFTHALDYLSDQQKNILIDRVIEGKTLTRLIKSPEDFHHALHYLSVVQKRLLFDEKMQHKLVTLINNIGDLHTAIKGLPSNTIKLFLNRSDMTTNLTKFISSSDAFISLFEDLDGNQKDILFNNKIIKANIPNLIDSSKSFSNLLEPLNEEQRNVVYKMIKDRLPDLITNAIDFKYALKYLTTSQREEIYRRLTNNIQTFIKNAGHFKNVIEYLPEDETEELYNLKLTNPNEFIKTPDNFKDVLKYLPSDQKDELIDAMRDSLPDLIDDIEHFSLVACHSNQDEKNRLFKKMVQKLPQMIRALDDFKKVAHYLSREEIQSLFEQEAMMRFYPIMFDDFILKPSWSGIDPALYVIENLSIEQIKKIFDLDVMRKSAHPADTSKFNEGMSNLYKSLHKKIFSCIAQCIVDTLNDDSGQVIRYSKRTEIPPLTPEQKINIAQKLSNIFHQKVEASDLSENQTIASLSEKINIIRDSTFMLEIFNDHTNNGTALLPLFQYASSSHFFDLGSKHVHELIRKNIKEPDDLNVFLKTLSQEELQYASKFESTLNALLSSITDVKFYRRMLHQLGDEKIQLIVNLEPMKKCLKETIKDAIDFINVINDLKLKNNVDTTAMRKGVIESIYPNLTQITLDSDKFRVRERDMDFEYNETQPAKYVSKHSYDAVITLLNDEQKEKLFNTLFRSISKDTTASQYIRYCRSLYHESLTDEQKKSLANTIRKWSLTNTKNTSTFLLAYTTFNNMNQELYSDLLFQKMCNQLPRFCKDTNDFVKLLRRLKEKHIKSLIDNLSTADSFKEMRQTLIEHPKNFIDIMQNSNININVKKMLCKAISNNNLWLNIIKDKDSLISVINVLEGDQLEEFIDYMTTHDTFKEMRQTLIENPKNFIDIMQNSNINVKRMLCKAISKCDLWLNIIKDIDSLTEIEKHLDIDTLGIIKEKIDFDMKKVTALLNEYIPIKGKKVYGIFSPKRNHIKEVNEILGEVKEHKIICKIDLLDKIKKIKLTNENGLLSRIINKIGNVVKCNDENNSYQGNSNPRKNKP